MKKRLAIIGAAEMGRMMAHYAAEDAGFEIAGFYDDFNDNSEFFNYPILGKLEDITRDFTAGKFDCLIMGIGFSHMAVRCKVFEDLKGQIPFANIIHSTAHADSSCILGEGIFILPGVHLDLGVEVEDNVIINIGCCVAHHSKIGRHSFLSSGVSMAGKIDVEPKCFIGVGASIADCLTIGEGSTIGGGSMVLRDVPPSTVSVGVPAKVIKQNQV